MSSMRENYYYTSNQPKNVSTYDLKQVQEPYRSSFERYAKTNSAPQQYTDQDKEFYIILYAPDPSWKSPYTGKQWTGIA